MHRFFIDREDFFIDYGFITDSDDINHIKKSLRIKEDELVEICIKNDKKEYYGKVSFPLENKILISDLIENKVDRESQVNITLFQGLPKSDKFEYIIQKSVELGVDNIYPVAMDRSIVKLTKIKDREKKSQRWNKIAYGAAKQSKRMIIPSVMIPINFEDMIKKFDEFDLIIFLYEDELNNKLKKIISKKNNIKNICIIVGPEGGFSELEASIIVENGGKSISLGNRILRTETAGIACISIIQYELGDLG